MRIQVYVLCSGLAVAVATLIACATPNLPDDSLDGTDPTNPTGETKKPSGTYTRDGGTAPRPGNSDGSGSTGSGTGSSGGGTPTPAPTTTPDGSAPAPTNACATSANQQTCYSCCESQNPTAVPFLDNEWGKCVCESPGACAGACANEYCSGNGVDPGGSCDNCLNAHADACDTQAESVCNATAACKPLFTCDSNSGCAAKPN